MNSVRRIGNIIGVVGRYRLDLLLDKQRLPLALRAILLPVALFGSTNQGRGERLRKSLEELGPIFVKFGQLLSTRPDLVPADISDELAELQDNVPPFSSALFRENVERALPSPMDTIFQSFDANPLASASVAQVHGAILADGRNVVVKAVRPNIEKTIRKDLALLYTLAKWVKKYSQDGERLHPVEVVQDYESVILGELNLQSEGANASLLRHNFSDSPLLHVPEIHWPYSNKDVLVMERIYGVPVTDMDQLNAAGVNLKLLAERGVEIFFTQVFTHNFFHADMHPGNIFVDISNPASPTYIAVDCAIMGSLSSDDQYYMARNLLAMFQRDYRLVAELHVTSGWVPKDTSINEFTCAIRSVCEPIFQRPLSEISLGHMLIDLFATARRFNMEVQPSLVLLQKTLLNIEGLGRQLYPDLDLWQTAQPYLEQWLKDRYSPKAMFKQLKRYGPDWLEQLPKIPPMVFEALENLQNRQLDNNQHKGEKDGEKALGRSGLAAVLGCSAIVAGVTLAMSNSLELQSQPFSISTGLVLSGLGILIIRWYRL
ncbi:ubiquinone biosynthesis regulatory protein kinase UbiB [Porticoccaceae bacterium]|nr:ubiquinone biosynthesis regulatory protein kinase UbiB [Porticoccaceae bacterium]MDB2634628.1 ubiquinone biosynthesis regulatory protein kinase UbiB [Porticoccaceae bacterium]MDB2664647.1 ubiquinone biosynthesis regulatory protein kinase UbiB [Porticoccaceae bacterium]